MVTADKLLFEKFNQLVDDQLDSPSLPIDAICETLGVSRSHLYRIVKENAEQSTSLYIRKRRLQKARQLLLTTPLRISEIGDVVGITNPQNFSTYFTDEFKISPSDFRKLNGQRSIDIGETPSQSAVETNTHYRPESVSEKPNQKLPKTTGFFRQRRAIYAGVITVILIVGIYLWFHSRPANHAAQPAGNSLVVVSFTNLGTADGDPACESIMDDIHWTVSCIKNLKVISRSSSDQYKNTKKAAGRSATNFRWLIY